jgi:hypothetical protein
VKVGYNLRRKIVLLSIWALSPVALYYDPTLLGLLSEPLGENAYLRRVGEVWLGVGAAGLLFRTVHLFFLKDVQTGLVWFTKILTDPSMLAGRCRRPVPLQGSSCTACRWAVERAAAPV